MSDTDTTEAAPAPADLFHSMRWQDRLTLYVFAVLTVIGALVVGGAVKSWIDDARRSCPAEEVMFIDVDSLAEWGVYEPDLGLVVGPGAFGSAEPL